MTKVFYDLVLMVYWILELVNLLTSVCLSKGKLLKKRRLKNTILSSNIKYGLQEGIVKFEVSVTLQAVLFEAARAAELSACSAANDKFKYRLVSLDLLFLLYQDKRKGIWIEVIDPI